LRRVASTGRRLCATTRPALSLRLILQHQSLWQKTVLSGNSYRIRFRLTLGLGPPGAGPDEQGVGRAADADVAGYSQLL